MSRILRSHSAIAVLALLLVIGLSGCAGPFALLPPFGPRTDTGTLVISVGNRAERSILPPSADITSAKYRISGTGPESLSFGPTLVTGVGATIGDLKAGDWSVTVEALNAGDTVIASETKTVTVEMYKIASVSFSLAPIAGTGTLEVTVSWPDNTASVAKAVGTLTPAVAGKEGFTVLKADTTLSGGTRSAKATISALPTGSYSLQVLFRDAGGSQIGFPMLAAATIYKDMTSSGTVAMSENLFPVEAPSIAPDAGSLLSTQAVTLSTTSANTSIYYSTDGSTPTMVSHKYAAPFALSGTDASVTVKAIAVRTDGAASAVSSATYAFLPPPTFSVTAGTYSAAQSVTLSSVQAGAEIRYTTDGTAPTASSNLYSGAISITQNTTLRAIAIKSGITSSVATATYAIQAATPTASPAAGTYANAQVVSLSTSTSGASIYYTIDGSIPSSTNGALYTGPISVDTSLTLRAITRSPNHANSDVLTAAYTITGTLAAPTFSVLGGTYYSPQNVTIGSASGTTIMYTTNGTTYTSTASNSVTLAISTSTFLIAYATNGSIDSQAVSAQYVIATQVEAPVVSLQPGTYSIDPLLTLYCATPGASMYYTTDGGTPSASSTLYTGAISLQADKTTLTVKAIAIKSGLADSAVVSGTYRWDSAYVSTPQVSPAGGTYTAAQTVSLSCPTDDASIRYTTDGTTPTETTGTPYSLPFSVSTDKTVKAVAYKTGMMTSTPASATYAFAKPAPSTLVAVGQFKKIAVTWPPVPGAISYNLYFKESYKTTDTFNTSTYTGKVTNAASGITFTTYNGGKLLPNGITIAYILTAVYGSGESVASGIVTSTPK